MLSDTNEYTLLMETGAAEEVLLPDHRNNPRTVLCGASSLKVNIFGSEEYATQGCELKGNILHVKLTDCFMLYSTLKGWLLFSAMKVQDLLLSHYSTFTCIRHHF